MAPKSVSPTPVDTEKVISPDLRDPRTDSKQYPCFQSHNPGKAGANAFGSWTHCRRCGLRLSYTPKDGYQGKHQVLANPKIVLKALHMIQTDLSPQVECTASLVQHTMSMLEKEEKLKSLQNQVIETEKELRVMSGKYRHLVTGQPAASSSQEREAMDIMSRLTASEYQHLRQITAERGRASLEEEELIPGPATPTSLTSWTRPRTPDS